MEQNFRRITLDFAPHWNVFPGITRHIWLYVSGFKWIASGRGNTKVGGTTGPNNSEDARQKLEWGEDWFYVKREKEERTHSRAATIPHTLTRHKEMLMPLSYDPTTCLLVVKIGFYWTRTSIHPFNNYQNSEWRDHCSTYMQTLLQKKAFFDKNQSTVWSSFACPSIS